MATVEFIQKRIEGKEKELAKLLKKMERIEKAQATNWDVNPYGYSEYDRRRTQKEISECEEALAGHKDQLTQEMAKANSRDIQVIIEFLEKWKARVADYYRASLPKYAEAKENYYKAAKAYSDWNNREKFRACYGLSKEERHELIAQKEEPKEKAKEALKQFSFLEPYVEEGYDQYTINEEKLQKALDTEANRKYDSIVEKTNAVVGQITDASFLRMGEKGDLNGRIDGNKGSAWVETIGAGGYNIQCFHFRTLIKPIKK